MGAKDHTVDRHIAHKVLDGAHVLDARDVRVELAVGPEFREGRTGLPDEGTAEQDPGIGMGASGGRDIGDRNGWDLHQRVVAPFVEQPDVDRHGDVELCRVLEEVSCNAITQFVSVVVGEQADHANTVGAGEAVDDLAPVLEGWIDDARGNEEVGSFNLAQEFDIGDVRVRVEDGFHRVGASGRDTGCPEVGLYLGWSTGDQAVEGPMAGECVGVQHVVCSLRHQAGIL
jgi:hypothetical protein